MAWHLRPFNFHCIGSGCITRFNWQAQSFSYRILFGFLDLSNLFTALAGSPLLLGLVRIGRGRVCLGVPVQVAPFRPTPYRRLEAVAQIILAVLRCGDIVPAEVDATTGACFADGRKEVHGSQNCCNKIVMVAGADSDCDNVGGGTVMKQQIWMRVVKVGS